MCPLAQLVLSFRLRCHQYAEDTQLQLLMSGHPDDIPENLTKGGWRLLISIEESAEV